MTTKWRVSVRAIAAVAAVLMAGALAAPASAAQNFSVAKAPSITGEARVGTWLKADIPAWKPAPTFTYEWRRDGKAIPGATGKAYKVQKADIGHQIKVKITGTKPGYKPTTRYSAATKEVRKGVIKVSNVAIDGYLGTGNTLEVKWSGVYPNDAQRTIQWRRAGVNIPGATSATYTQVAADAGKEITAKVSWKKAGYYTKNAYAKFKTFTTTKTTVSGKVRFNSWIKANTSKWPTGTTFTYQWYRDGSPISGATKKAYKPGAGDIGHALKVKVTGSASGYKTASAYSATTAKVAKGYIKVSGLKLEGTKKPGAVLKVSVKDFAPKNTVYTIKWKRNGYQIPGATGSTYTVKHRDIGMTISAVLKVSAGSNWQSRSIKVAAGKVARPATGIQFSGNKTLKVGVDIKPGIYVAKNTAGNFCSWERYDGPVSDGSNFVAADNSYGQAIVEVESTDKFLKVSNCGSWKHLGAETPRATYFGGDDVIAVGVHVKAGKYRSVNNYGYCSVEWMTRPTGEYVDSLDIQGTTAQIITLTVRDDEPFISTTGCNRWKKIS